MIDIADAVEKIQQRYIAAVAGRNVKALVQLYDPKVRVFDAWGIWEYVGTEAWQIAIEGWFASQPVDKLQVSFNGSTVLGTMDLATMTAIVTYASIAPGGTESQSMQNRMTWTLKTAGHNLRIIHEHTSAPIGFEDMKAILKRPA
jgi:ketosteroid isomerase-like protein